MAAAARKITVIVDGDSAPLQAALDAAVASLGSFNKVLADTAAKNVSAGRAVTGSANDISASSKKVVTSLGDQNAAVAKLGKGYVSLGDVLDATAAGFTAAMQDMTAASSAAIDAQASLMAKGGEAADFLVAASRAEAQAVQQTSVAFSEYEAAGTTAYDAIIAASRQAGAATVASFSEQAAAVTEAGTGYEALVGMARKAEMAAVNAASAFPDTFAAGASAYEGLMGLAQRNAAVTSAAVDEQLSAITQLGAAWDEFIPRNLRVEQSFEAMATSSELAAEKAIAADEELVAAAGRADAAMNNEARVSTRSSGIIEANNAKAAKSFGASGTALVGWGKKAALGVAGIGLASVYMSAKFEQSMTRLHTQAGASVKELHQLEAGVLSLGSKGGMGQTPKQLEEGLYHIVSSMDKVLPAGTRVNEMLHIMSIAAQGASVGGTSMQETSYALASAMNSLHLHGKDAYKTMGNLNAIVGSGDMTMQDLLASMKSGVIPTADQFGVSLQSLGAAMAVMGDMGMKGAQSGTRLRMSLALLGGPSKQAADILTTLGMSAKEVTTHNVEMAKALETAGLHTTTLAEDMRKPNGLAVALKDLRDHLMKAGLTSEAAAGVMVRAFGGGRMAATIDLLSQNVGRIQVKYRQIGEESKHFGADYKAQSETLSHQLKETLSEIETLGISIGKDLTPLAKSALHELKDMAHWLDQNKLAAEALAGVIGVGLATVLTAFTVNKVGGLVSGLKAANGEMGRLLGYGGRGAASSAAAAGAGGGYSSRLTGGTIVGARGMMLPGSLANPIVVAIESGQFAGLGGLGAKSTSEAGTLTTTEKQVAAGEAGVPAGVAPAPAGGLVAKEGPTFAQRSMRAGLIGLGGIMASEFIGDAVGGKTGHEISGVLKDASVGGAIGYAAGGPIGAAIGAAAVPLGRALFRELEGHTQAENVAANSARGTNPGVGGSFVSSIERINKLAQKTISDAEHRPHGSSELHGAHKTSSPEESARIKAEAKRSQDAELFSAGRAFGGGHFKEITAVTKGFDWQAKTTAIITDLEKRFADPNLPNAARAGAYSAILAMVKTYEEKGKLPPGAVGEINKAIVAKFPALARAFGNAGTDSVSALNRALMGQHTLTGLEGMVNEWRNIFPELPKIVGINAANSQEQMEGLNAKLLELAHTGPESQRAAYHEIYTKVRDQEIKLFGQATDGANREVERLKKLLHAHAPGAVAPLVSAIQNAVGIVKDEMALSVKSVADGTSEIGQKLTTELKALGVDPNSATNKKSGAFGPQAGGGGSHGHNPLIETQPGGSSGFEGVTPGAAQGALIQLGRPGEAGKDSIPMSVGGADIIAAPGETAAIFTRHQRKDIEERLPGGLPGVFANKRPNYMASGGFVAAPGTNYTAGQEPQIAADLSRLGHYLHVMLTGISGYRTPQHSVAVGGFPNDPHTRGEASDTLGTQSISAQILARFGLERPFPGAAEADHMQLLGSLNHPHGPIAGGTSGGGRAGATGGGGGAAWSAIKAPHAGGRGVFHAIAQAALRKVTAAANAKGEAAAGSAAGGGPSGGKAAGNAQMRAWAKAGLQAAGLPGSAAEVSTIVYTMSRESGGNPRSENTWDSNAKAGHPSRGLMELIPENFSHYHVAGTSNDVFDPVANVAAAVRYMIGTYGHIVGKSPYESGGLIPMAGGSENVKASAAKAKKPHTGKGHGFPSGLQTIISKVGKLPETANVESIGKTFHSRLDALGNLKGLLGNLQSLPGHETLSSEDMGLLGPAMKLSGLDFQPGEPVETAIESTVKTEIVAQGSLLEAEKAVDTEWKELQATYEAHRKQVREHQKREMKRYLGIKAHIDRLTKGSLEARLKAAKTRAYDQSLAADAHEAKDSLATMVRSEMALPPKLRDKASLQAWRNKESELSSYIRHLSKPASGVGSALVALRKNELTHELGPIENELAELGGEKTKIGHGGRYGKLSSGITALKDGHNKLQGIERAGESATIPDLKIELMRDEQSGGGGGQASGTLEGLLKQQLQIASETIAVQGAELAALSSMKNVPHYEKGGPVLDTGLAVVHRGEHVVPVGGTLISKAGPTNVQVNNHVSGEIAPLIALIDSRVTHPENVRHVSREIGRRTTLLSR